MLHTFQFNYYIRDCLLRSCYCERGTIYFNACNNNNNVGQQTVVQIYLNRDIIAQMTIVRPYNSQDRNEFCLLLLIRCLRSDILFNIVYCKSIYDIYFMKFTREGWE